ncbi:MAG: methylmalonyl-CoA epimerase [Deltaproteobacteria bacterium]|nr:methylmalonyl-CoA epimerase [Deltaproteobacteria bacterium]
MKINRISHIGLAVKDVDMAKSLYTDKLGLEIKGEEMLGELKIAFVPVGETSIECVQSTTAEGVMCKFIEKKGEGIHHIAFEVDDIEAAVEELKGRGVAMIDQKPRPGAHGTKVAFLHPKGTYGVLIELVQPGAGH